MIGGPGLGTDSRSKVIVVAGPLRVKYTSRIFEDPVQLDLAGRVILGIVAHAMHMP